MKKCVVAILLAATALCLFATPAMAMDEPDSVSLYDIEVFQDLLVEDDFLGIAPYHIPFETQPDNNINKTFIFSILSADGSTTIGSALAYPRFTGGYGYGIVSFYFESGTVWDTSYIFRVQENPAFYSTPQYWDFPIGPSNYSDDTNQEDALRGKILDVAQDLTTEYEVDLLSTSDSGTVVLSTYGELYFLYAVPGIQSMCPKLFSVQIEEPTYEKRDWSYTLANALKTKYAGTIIEDFMTGFAGMFSMDTSPAMNILSVLLFATLILVSVWKFKATTLSAFTDGYALLLVLMLDGFFSMILAGLIAFLSVVIGGIILFLNK